MRNIKYHLPVILYAGLIFYLSSISNLPKELPSFEGSDKIIHIIEFGLFGALIWLSVSHWNLKFKAPALIIITILLGLLYALSDELHQYTVPGRQFDIYDLLADTIGLAVGSITFYIFRKRKGMSKQDADKTLT